MCVEKDLTLIEIEFLGARIDFQLFEFGLESVFWVLSYLIVLLTE